MRRFVVIALVAGLAAGEPLDTILAHMDVAAKTSNSFSANIVWRKYTKAIDDTEEQTGTLKLMRSGNRVVGRLDMEKPNVFTWRFTPGTWEKYLPKAKEIQVWNPEKVSKSANQLFLMIFGNTSANVRKTYDATAVGEESVNGIKATKLELIPKDKKVVKDYVAKIELWIPVGQAYAVQQRVTQPNGDFDLQIYNNVILNPSLPASAFDFVPPPGTKQKIMN
jgi:outer membrane lipoprotein-sorting protein